MKWICLIIVGILLGREVIAAHSPGPEELAAAAKQALDSLPGLDKTEGIKLTDQVPEHRFSGSCRGLTFIRAAASSLLGAEGFERVVADLAYPRNSSVFLSSSAKGPALEKVVLYFTVTKSSYIECQYVVGAFAADVGRPKALGGDMQTETGTVASRVLDQLQARIIDAPLRSHAPEGIDALKRYEVTDPLLRAARDHAQRLLPDLAPPALRNIQLLVLDLPPNAAANLQLFRTRTCTGAYRAFSVPVIICSGEFLRGVETAVRRFEDANDLITSESRFLDFARGLEANPAGVLARLRSSARNKPAMESHTMDHLEVGLLFFSGHELGHLLQMAEGRLYGRPPGDREDRNREIRASVVNLCKQADAMAADGFRLQGFDHSRGPFWSKRVGQIESQYRKELGELQAQRDMLWANEVDADQVGTEFSLKYLKFSARAGQASLLEKQHLLIETVFAVGIVSWYRDLAVFMDATCGSISNSAMLNQCFASKREGFAAAGRLFGDAHRHLLLRSLQVVRAVIERRKELFEKSFIPGRQVNSSEDLRRADPVAAQREIWRLGDVQRYEMIEALIDTPLKLAYAGCASGWYAELKATNGPKFIMFDFYRIEDELARLFPPQPSSRDGGKYDSWFALVLRLARQPSGPPPGPDALFHGSTAVDVEDLAGVRVPYFFTFYCEYHAGDTSPEPRGCFNALRVEWLRYLSSQKMDSQVVVDATETGWTRTLYSVTESGSERFCFIFESEEAGSMGYAKIRIAGPIKRLEQVKP